MLKQKHENEFHFALVESVLQLKTLDAYVENNENKVHLIIRLNGERKNEQEILNFIKLRDERYSSVQILNIQRKNKIHLLLNIFKLKILLLGKKKITLIVGDPHARWMNIISSFKNIQNVTYLEDGMSTVLFYKNFKPKYYNKNYKLITRLNLEGNVFLPIIPMNIKNKLNPRIDNNVALLIGMPMIENNAMSKENYLSYLQKTLMSLKEMKVTKFHYAPHRYESDKNFYLYKDLGFQILYPDCSIEDYLINEDFIPGICASFYSTALLQIGSLFSGVSVICYIISVDKLNYDFRDPASCAYEYYDKIPSIIKVVLDD